MSKLSAVRYHDFSSGHRVAGHESVCSRLHGHNYRVYFHCEGELDLVGRVIDFSVIKEKLCEWLEDNFDHNFLMWQEDPWLSAMSELPGLLVVPFNPTAENIGLYLLETVGPQQLNGTGVTLVKVTVEETRKCSAEAVL